MFVNLLRKFNTYREQIELVRKGCIVDDNQNVPSLDETEQEVWRNILRGMALMRDRIGSDLDHDSHLQGNEYEILTNLRNAEDHKMRMSDLATEVVHSRSRLTHTVKRLEKEGLVKRCCCSKDRRGIFCCLTETGLKRVEEATPNYVRSVRHNLFDRLTREEALELGCIAAKLI